VTPSATAAGPEIRAATGIASDAQDLAGDAAGRPTRPAPTPPTRRAGRPDTAGDARRELDQLGDDLGVDQLSDDRCSHGG
jgi:hypothetical protein